MEPIDQADDFPDEAVPLIEVSEDKKTLRVGERAAELLSRIEEITSVNSQIAVVGLYRTGKSSLLNFLNGKQAGFRVGIYGRPQEVRLRDGSRCAVLLLDTEGVGGLEADSQYDTRIFALSCLMCATLVYNSLGSIDENAISQLSFVAQLSKHIRFSRPSEEAAGGDKDTLAAEADEDAAALCQFMPSFNWVLRDFALELCDEHGEAITTDEYLESALKPQKGYEASVLERNRVRHMLTAFFHYRACNALVRPVNDEAKLQQIDDLDPSEIRDEFKRGVADLRDSLFAPENVRPKTIRGARLSGATYLELLRQYVTAVNDGGVPVISSAWDHVSNVECESAKADALALYDGEIEASPVGTGAVLEAQQLATLCQRAADKAAERFGARAVGDVAARFREEVMEELGRRGVKLEEANLAGSEKLCNDLLSKLYMDLVWDALSKVSSDDGDDDATAIDLATELESTWAELRLKYSTQSKGPARALALLAFASEKWPESMHELVRRLDSRHDTTERKERERLLEIKRSLAESDGATEARQHILFDAQAALIGAQSEKARFEARAQAALRQLNDQRAARKKEKEQFDVKLHQVELQMEKLQSQLKTTQQEVEAKEEALQYQQAKQQPAKAGCECVLA